MKMATQLYRLKKTQIADVNVLSLIPKNAHTKKLGKNVMKTDKRIKLGRLFVVVNKNRHIMANKEYIHTYLQGGSGSPVPYMFTESQLKDARERAAKNFEDCLPLARWWRIW